MEIDREGRMKLFIVVTLNGLTLGALYFLVASGFTLIFGLMRTVNMAHGAMFLFGGYVAYDIADYSGNWYLGAAAGAAATAGLGLAIQQFLLAPYQGQDLRQALITIGLSIIMADLMLAWWGGLTFQFEQPEALGGTIHIPGLVPYAKFRVMLIVAAGLVGLGLWAMLAKTRIGMTIRAGVDDREMLQALGVPVNRVFLLVFGLGAGLTGLAGAIGGTALSIAPGTDVDYLMSSLLVVIVGGMGSVGGAALGAVLVGLAQQYGLAYSPDYGIVYTFALMVAVLAIRPQGLLGKAR